ncbi:hypothetical protein PTKIN_Ptkin06aG0176800 [Pterospermum kingtungense]
MKIVSWNIRGLRCAEKKKAVRRLFSNRECDTILLQESKIKEVNPRLCRWLWGNNNVSSEFVLSNGNAGGLVIGWKSEFFSLEEKMVPDRYLLLVGTLKEFSIKCGIGNVYAPSRAAETEALWEELSQIIGAYDFPWIIGGDFNVVRREEEKIRLFFNISTLSNFSNFIEELGFIDLPLSGVFLLGAVIMRSEHSVIRIDFFAHLAFLCLFLRLCISFFQDHYQIIT